MILQKVQELSLLAFDCRDRRGHYKTSYLYIISNHYLSERPPLDYSSK
jgi:hypothetical protein